MRRLFNLSLKTYIASLLIVLAVIGIAQQKNQAIYSHLILSIFAAVALDSILSFIKEKRLIFPSSAFISGLIIALVLNPESRWFVPVVASAVAMLGKHLIRIYKKHIFNPANFGLLFVLLFFSASLTWWGQSFWPLIVLVGLFVCYKMKRLAIVFSFIITFVILLLINNFATKHPLFDFIYLLNLFFIFVMLVEPKTSPITKKGQVMFAVLTALFSFAFFKLKPEYDFSILSLGLANIFVPFLNKLK